MDLEPISESLRRDLDAKTAAREEGLAASRSCIRSCGNAIRAMHRNETETAEELLDAAQRDLDAAKAALAEHPDVLHAGFVHDAEKEVVEARITFALTNDSEIPTPEELRTDSASYLKGMAESIGELRRYLLDLMRQGDLKRCEQLLARMDDMYYVLVTMDYPDGITRGLRRLTDVARSIIERTRGDFTTSTVQSSLRDALNKHASSLEGK